MPRTAQHCTIIFHFRPFGNQYCDLDFHFLRFMPPQPHHSLSGVSSQRPIAYPLWILIGLFALYLIGTVVWWQFDRLPPHWDMVNHLEKSRQYADALRAGQLPLFLWQLYAYYPPLIYQMTGLLYTLFSSFSIWIPRALMLLCTALVYLYTFRLGATFFSKKTGVIAAGLVLFCPVFYTFSRDFLLDIPLLAVTTVTLYVLVHDPFGSVKKSFGLGSLLGLGMLVKWTYGLFIAAPLVYSIVVAVRFSSSRQKTLSRILLVLVLGSGLAIPWYQYHFSQLQADAQHVATTVGQLEQDPPLYTLHSFFYYLEMIINEYLYLPLTVLAGLGMIQLKKQKEHAFLLFWGLAMVPAYLIFSCILNKDPRYIIPLLPLLGLVAAYAMSSLTKPKAFYAVIGVLSSYLSIQFAGSICDLGYASTKIAVPSINRYIIAYEKKDPPEYFAVKHQWNAPVLVEWTLYNPFSYFGRLPRAENWHIATIANLVLHTERVYVAVNNDIFLNAKLIQYQTKIQGKQAVYTDSADSASLVICQRELCPADLTATDSPSFSPASYTLPNGTEILAFRQRYTPRLVE